MSGHQRTYYRKDLVLFQRGGSQGWHGYHYHVTKVGLLVTPQHSQLVAKVTFLIPQPMVIATVSSSINNSSFTLRYCLTVTAWRKFVTLHIQKEAETQKGQIFNI